MEMQDNSLYFCNIDVNEKNQTLIECLKEYSEKQAKQVYVLNAPLGESSNRYEYEDVLVILIPKCKICFINLNADQEELFEDFCEDFIDDIGYLSDKYDYRPEIGRPRTWKKKLVHDMDISEFKNIDDLIDDISINDLQDSRTVDYLISLLIGSINDISKIGGEYPSTILDQVKKKIILFDGDQSRFVYSKIAKKRITIQGLAGTGKTELLLHKLKDLYTKDKDSKIVFTCFNNILARSLKMRVPDFFNFMRVNEQIEWESRLWVMPSWGSGSKPNSGLYSYICSAYKIPFHSFSYLWTFEKACTEAMTQLEEKENFEPIFDYILIDESQDFSEAFFKLCEKVTRKTIYVAGDIFQDIYDRNVSQSVDTDFLLNKCYRTDPRTLMFAHAVGMGLYEQPVIRWLEDSEWQACGYTFDRKNGNVQFSRAPLRRFEDLDMTNVEPIQVLGCDSDLMGKKICEIIQEIRVHHPTVAAGDIAVVFLEGSNKNNYELADTLSVLIKKKFEWKSVKGYETKSSSSDAVFISNRNNIKGLEFPFVICIINGYVSQDVFSRNTIYMMLTRSFISSYLLINDGGGFANKTFIEKYSDVAKTISKEGTMLVHEPDQAEKDAQNQKVRIATSKKRVTINDIINEQLSQYPGLAREIVQTIIDTVIDLFNRSNGMMTDQEIIEKTHLMVKVYK